MSIDIYEDYKPQDWTLALLYHAYFVMNRESEYNWSPNGSYNPISQSDYENNITWYDSDPKPDYTTDLLPIMDVAFEWLLEHDYIDYDQYKKILFIRMNTALKDTNALAITNAEDIETLQSNVETLESAVSGLSASVVKKKFFKASVAGGSGNVVFYTDSNGDGTGDALYSGLTADDLSLFVDSVSDQYAFPTITVAGDKKSVTVNVKKLSFTSSNFLTTLGGLLSSALTGQNYVNASNGLVVKMIIGIDD